MSKFRVIVCSGLAAACMALAPSAQAQWRGKAVGPFPNGPPHGPPATRWSQTPAPQVQRPSPSPPAPGAPAPARAPGFRPHVDRNANWVGHQPPPRDERLRLAHPWHSGRFAGRIGRGHLYRISGWNGPRHRFWFGRSAFVVAEPDWGYVGDWDWDNDQIVLYDDPDDAGWYLAYNVRLGTYVHVAFDGSM